MRGAVFFPATNAHRFRLPLGEKRLSYRSGVASMEGPMAKRRRRKVNEDFSAFTRLLPELLGTPDQATARAAGMNEVSLPPARAQKRPRPGRSRLELAQDALIKCRSLLADAAPREKVEDQPSPVGAVSARMDNRIEHRDASPAEVDLGAVVADSGGVHERPLCVAAGSNGTTAASRSSATAPKMDQRMIWSSVLPGRVARYLSGPRSASSVFRSPSIAAICTWSCASLPAPVFRLATSFVRFFNCWWARFIAALLSPWRREVSRSATIQARHFIFWFGTAMRVAVRQGRGHRADEGQ